MSRVLYERWSSGSSFSVKEATERHITSMPEYGAGAIETLERSTERAVDFLGRLTEKLHAKGVLSDAEVVDLLDGFEWREAEVD